MGRPRPETAINYPNTRSHPAEDHSEHQEEDTDNFNFGDLIRANSQSELVENNESLLEANEIHELETDNILQPDNIQVQIIEQATGSGITLQTFSDETSCVQLIWWNLFEQCKICNNYNDERAVANLPFHLSGQALLWYHNLESETQTDLVAMQAAFLQRFPCLKTNKQMYKLQQSEN